MDAMDNPIVDNMVDSSDVEADAAAVDVGSLLASGSVTAQEAIAMVERKMEAKEDKLLAKIEQMEQASGLEAVTRAVSKLAEAPPNLHQYVIFAATGGAGDDRCTPWMAVGAWVLVLMQAAVTGGLFVGTYAVSCVSSDMCDSGSYCAAASGSALATDTPASSRCQYCGDHPFPPQFEGADCVVTSNEVGGSHLEYTTTGPDCVTYNNVDDSRFAGFNLTLVHELCAQPKPAPHGAWGKGMSVEAVTRWCQACVRNDGTVDTWDMINVVESNVKAMGRAVSLPGFAVLSVVSLMAAT